MNTCDIWGKAWKPCAGCPHATPGSCPSRRHPAYCEHRLDAPEYWDPVIAQEPPEDRVPEGYVPIPVDATWTKTRRLVVTRYHEDLGWLHSLPEGIPITVYNHGGAIESSRPGVTVVETRNVGREAHGMIKYINDNWNSLPELVFFSQGDLIHCPDLASKLTVDWTQPTSLAPRYLESQPPKDVTDQDYVYQDQGYEIRLGIADVFGQWKRAPNNRNSKWCDLIWSRVFACKRPSPMRFGYAATWVVPRDVIQRRSIEFWSWALEVIEGKAGESTTDRNDKHPLTPWAWEALWFYVWSDPVLYPWRQPKPKVSRAGKPSAMAQLPSGGCGCGGNKPPVNR